MESLGPTENLKDEDEYGKEEFRQRNCLDFEREPILYARPYGYRD